ncbi:MAG: hypothetical protein ABI042_01355 [Verrucomicrobiota bacterium]
MNKYLIRTFAGLLISVGFGAFAQTNAQPRRVAPRQGTITGFTPSPVSGLAPNAVRGFSSSPVTGLTPAPVSGLATNATGTPIQTAPLTAPVAGAGINGGVIVPPPPSVIVVPQTRLTPSTSGGAATVVSSNAIPLF